MPRMTTVQTSFSAGEITPRLHSHTDLDRYNNGARKLLNAIPVKHGGAKRRPGSKYVQITKNSGTRARLIPFVYSRDVAYMLEVGHFYLRIFGAGGVDLSIELPTSYSETMLGDIDYAQGADTMLLAHPSVPMQRLRRFSASSFGMSETPFVVAPFAEQGHYPAADLTLSATTAGGGRTATASASAFLETDVGRQLICDGGVATVSAVASATSATVDITTAFASASAASGTWYLDGSPQGFIRAFSTTPLGASVSLAGAKTRSASLGLSALTGAITITASAAVFTAGDVGKRIYSGNSMATINVFTDALHVGAQVETDFLSTELLSGSYGIAADVWRPEDVGKYVRVNEGLLKITAVGPANNAIATIERELTSEVAAPPMAWSLESSEWTAATGYPRTVTLHEQRLVAAGTTRKPQTFWGSRTGEYLDFTKGTADDDAYSFTIQTDEVNPIGYVASMRNLVVHTFGGEFSVQGGVEKPVTPTNVRVRPETSHGSLGVRPITVGKESIFVQRSGRKVRALGYAAGDDEYIAPDLTVMAEHITAGGITELAFQQEPDALVWAAREDGAFLSCTLDREQAVTAWAGHITEGWVESIATIPNGDRDETWMIVRRIVNGNAVRYIEIMEDTFEPILPGAAYVGLPPAPQPTDYGYPVDCGISFDDAGGQSTFSVPHLIGCTVDIVADGCALAQQLVPPSGSITIDRSSQRTLIGLHFESEIGLLEPEVGTGSGSAQGNSMRVGEITLSLLNTLGAKVLDGDGQEQEVPWRQLGEDVLDTPPTPFTGLHRLENLGWERGQSAITIKQDLPLPLHVRAVIRKVTVND